MNGIVIIVIALLGVQYFLSTRKNLIFGGILPLIVIPFFIWVIRSRSLTVNFDIVFPFVGLFIVLLGIWTQGRDSYKKKQKREMDKMKAIDINE